MSIKASFYFCNQSNLVEELKVIAKNVLFSQDSWDSKKLELVRTPL
jgi:hypothetical protein